MTLQAFGRSAALIAGVLGLAQGAAAQRRPVLPFDSTVTRFRVESSELRVEEPMVFAVVDSTSDDVPKFDQQKQVAESLGYSFVVRQRADGLQLQDPRYSAVYYVPSYLRHGYIIMTPGRRPIVIHQFVTADSLRLRIADYHRLSRDLTPGP